MENQVEFDVHLMRQVGPFQLQEVEYHIWESRESLRPGMHIEIRLKQYL